MYDQFMTTKYMRDPMLLQCHIILFYLLSRVFSLFQCHSTCFVCDSMDGHPWIESSSHTHIKVQHSWDTKRNSHLSNCGPRKSPKSEALVNTFHTQFSFLCTQKPQTWALQVPYHGNFWWFSQPQAYQILNIVYWVLHWCGAS